MDDNERRSWEFIVPGRSVGKQSVRVAQKTTKSGRPYVGRYFQPKTSEFIARVKLFANCAHVPMLDRCRIRIEICLPLTRKHFKTKPTEYSEPLVRPDEDNVSKSIKDALKGIAYRDDKHVMGRIIYYVFTFEEKASTNIIIEEVDWKEYIEKSSSSDPDQVGLFK